MRLTFLESEEFRGRVNLSSDMTDEDLSELR